MRHSGEVNRAKRRSLPLYCDRNCAGLARRTHKTKAQKVEEKRLYDAARRARLGETLLAKKRARYHETFDREKAAAYRKKRMPYHVEYCRQPAYVAKKRVYDQQYRAKKVYGPFAEAAMVAIDLNREIKGRMTNHEIRWENKTCNKTQFRDRDSQGPRRDDSRPRNRSGAHQEPVG